MDPRTSRVVLITGASSGIGRACASYLAQRGYRVYGTSRRTQGEPGPTDAESAAGDPAVSAAGTANANAAAIGAVTLIQMDVDDGPSVERGVDHVLKREGRLDVVVNNAGIALAGAIEDIEIDEAKALFETNFYGVLRVCKAVLPAMRSQGSGTIVNVGSLSGLLAIPFEGMYCASKYALEGLTEALRMEVRPFGVQVSLIEPGDYRTQLTANRLIAAGSQGQSAYLAQFKAALSVIERDELSASTPEDIARLLERIIEDPSPRLRYAIGPPSERAAVWLKTFVPARLFEWGVMKYYGLR